MALVFPFRALRPRAEFVCKVPTLPYDVFSLEEARDQIAKNPFSFLRIEKAQCELPDSIVESDEKAAKKARENLNRFRAEKIFFQDESESFYIYRQQARDHVQTGIAACLSTREYRAGRIKTHELTLAGKERERMVHINSVGAHTGPVFLVYRGRREIDDLVSQFVIKDPEYDFIADDGVRHTVWMINETQAVQSLKDAFSLVETFYVADGHHRAAAAAQVAELKVSGDAERTERDLMLAVLVPHDQVKILGYNRVVRDLNGFSRGTFLDQIEKKFSIARHFKSGLPERPRDFGMYFDGEWFLLSARPELFGIDSPHRPLDVSILQDHILGPMLGIRDPRTDRRIGFIGGAKGASALERAVDKGDFKIAFSLYPPTIEEMMAIADAGGIMPPKSTWFEPKLLSGLFVHLLDS